MSLSTQLSVDSQATWHDEDIEMNSEDWVLSQVANKILNEANNTKGKERNGLYPWDSGQQFFIVVKLNERTRYGVKFLDENLIFCPLQDEPSSTRHSTWEIQLHPEGNSGPPYDAVDPSIKLQEGYYQNPSITTGQTMLSDPDNLERKESFDSFNSSNLLYPEQSINTSLIEDYPQPNYSQPSYSQPSYLQTNYFSRLYTEQIDSFDSLFMQQHGEFEFFYDSPYTCTDTTIVQ